MFQNYQERGKRFKAIVQDLNKEKLVPGGKEGELD
jgi:hypothetical protein